MGLAAAHGLLEFEHGLAGLAGEALQSLPKERPHSAGDVSLPKERLGRLRIVPDEILETLDLVAQRVVDSLRIELADIPDRLQRCYFPSLLRLSAEPSSQPRLRVCRYG